MRNVLDEFLEIWKVDRFALIDFVRYLHRRGMMVSDEDAGVILQGRADVVAHVDGMWVKV